MLTVHDLPPGLYTIEPTDEKGVYVIVGGAYAGTCVRMPNPLDKIQRELGDSSDAKTDLPPDA